MKKYIYITLLVLSIVILSSCSSVYPNKANEENLGKPVKTVDLIETGYPLYLEYIGMVKPEEIKKYSFKTSGRIEKIYTEKGEFVLKGTPLIQLSSEDLNAALKASRAQLDSASSQYNKALKGATAEEINQIELKVTQAQLAYKHRLDLYNKMKELHEAGVISKQDLDNSKLELDLSRTELNLAEEVEKHIKEGTRKEDLETLRSQLNMAEADFHHKESLLEDAIIFADTDGYTMDILYKVGEMAPAGHPVVVFKGEGQILKTGISQKDKNSVEVGMSVIVKGNDIEVVGEVIYIHPLPDEQTLTYETEISIPYEKFSIGEILKLSIEVSHEEAVQIPIQSIMSNDIDYVFLVKEGKVEKREIEILEIRGSNVTVKGLENGEELVVQGMKRLKPADKVIVER